MNLAELKHYLASSPFTEIDDTSEITVRTEHDLVTVPIKRIELKHICENGNILNSIEIIVGKNINDNPNQILYRGSNHENQN